MANIEKNPRRARAACLGMISILILSYAGTISAAPQVDLVVLQPDGVADTLPEIDEYATAVLGDPWDMNQSTDLDFFYAYESNLTNSSFANGIYSAQLTAGDGRERITLLSAGAQSHEALRIGKMGYNYPIDATRYRYLTFRMYSSPSDGTSGLVQWFADDSGSSGAMGVSNSFAAPPSGNRGPGWYTYVLDMKTIGIVMGGTPWGGTVRQLILHPFAGSSAAGATVKLDWARLTAADPRTARPYPIQWTSNGTGGAVTLYASPNDQVLDANDILIAANQSASGSYIFQTGVLPAGQYYIAAVNKNGVAWGQKPLTINTPPQIRITKPSMTSGPEYGAEVNGNAWDMSDTTDLNDDVPPPLQTCVTNQRYSNGIYAASVPLPVCPAGQPYADPILYLGHMNRYPPGTLDPVIDTNKYRYLTYRFTESGTRFSMMRFGWWQINATDNGVNEAPILSRDILIIDGWHTYQIDLWAADLVDESYPSGTPGWRQSHPNRLRLDPNELGVADLPVTIQLDWIKLTAMDSVVKGTPFPIEFEVAAGQPQNITLYYNTDKNPANSGTPIGTMTVGNQSQPSASVPFRLAGRAAGETSLPSSALNYHVYLASLQNKYLACSGNCYAWDTSRVPVGTYYVCVRADDGYNSTQQCSEAPVAVTQ